MEMPFSLLIADDEEVVLRHMKSYIQRNTKCFGRIYCARNGQEALDAVFRYQPDVLLLDVKMPVKSGLDVMKEARMAGKCPKTIIMSGYDTFSYAQQALRLGAVDYLLKPCRSTEVLQKLESLVMYSRPQEIVEVVTEGNVIIKEATEYIREHLSEELNQKIVAEQVGVTTSYLSTLFTQEFGYGFVDYLNKQRMELACDYMHDGKMKIYEMAYRAGFKDEKYFSKVFKKVTGKSPSEYRRAERLHPGRISGKGSEGNHER